jgi:multidrug efflux pump subunit AcrA (membrane-fusion protein)
LTGKKRGEMKKIGQFIKKHKVLFIVLAVVVVIAVVVAVNVIKAKNAISEVVQETYNLEKRDLVNTVTATGKIASVDSEQIIVTAANGLEITYFDLKIGDQVKEGDLIATFDVTELERDLADAEANLNVTEGQSGLTVKGSELSYNDALTTQAIDAQRNAADTAKAQADADKAYNDKETARSEYEAAKSSLEAQKGYYDENERAIQDLKDKIDNFSSAETAFTEAVAALNGQNIYVDANANPANLTGKTIGYTIDESGIVDDNSIRENVKKLNTASALYDRIGTRAVIEGNIAGAESTLVSKEAALKSAETALDSSESALETQKRSQADTTRRDANSVTTAQNSLTSSRLSASVSGLSGEKTVRQLEAQLEDCNLKAPISGIVTEVNFKQGDKYNSGSALVTIEDNSAYQIVADIDEYDINKVEVGQRVVFKTNATGDLEMEGHVTEVAPRATSIATSGGSNNTTTASAYKVKIAITSDISDLRMDMTAKLNIVTTELKNVFAVPRSAILKDDEGKSYLTKPDGSSLYVTEGISTDYYVEVSGNGLTEGMELLIPMDESAYDIETIMLDAGAAGGM